LVGFGELMDQSPGVVEIAAFARGRREQIIEIRRLSSIADAFNLY
jgi:hypothetical protein